MPNKGGANQFGGFELQQPYGDVKRQTQLTKEAPISGAPLDAMALNAPRRAGQQATRPARPQAPQGAQPTAQPMAAPTQPNPASLFHEIAQIPGASNLVRNLFGS